MTKCIMILALFFSFTSMAQDSIKCEGYYSTLRKYEKRNSISINDVENCFKTIINIVQSKCATDDNFSVTPAIEHIIKKARDENAVKYYFFYLITQKGSAEEQLSLSLDSILSVYPKEVLRIISSYPDSVQIGFCNSLAWGFANNYYEETKNKSSIDIKYYFSKHPGINKFYSKHKTMIDKVIISVNETLLDDRDNRK
jgi:hypothetical protein